MIYLKKALLMALLAMVSSCTQISSKAQSSLSVKDIMNSMVTPMTNIIWGAQDLKTDSQWKTVENAALTIIAAGEILAVGGSGEQDLQWATSKDWQSYNREMIVAANGVIEAVRLRDAEALFDVGNNGLYPPCESCHLQFQQR